MSTSSPPPGTDAADERSRRPSDAGGVGRPLRAGSLAAWLGVEIDEAGTTEKVISAVGGAIGVLAVVLVCSDALGIFLALLCNLSNKEPKIQIKKLKNEKLLKKKFIKPPEINSVTI